MSETNGNGSHLAISTKVPLVGIIVAALTLGGMVVQLQVLQSDIADLKMEVRELASKVDKLAVKAVSQK